MLPARYDDDDDMMMMIVNIVFHSLTLVPYLSIYLSIYLSLLVYIYKQIVDNDQNSEKSP